MTLKETYQKKVVPALMEQFGYKNRLAVPRIIKTIVNVGISSKQKDDKISASARDTLQLITGQKAVSRTARKSISDFKIRKGQAVGLMVTLRGSRMYDFLERLITLTFPRVRDFRGLQPDSFDQQGNASFGFRESVAFPEVKPGIAEMQHGLEITIVTSAKNKEEGLALLKLMGFPFRDQ